MFDYIKCEAPLPETPVPPNIELFQTKDTPDQYLTVYTITADGRLTWKPYDLQEVPKAERPHPGEDGILGLCGSVRRLEKEPEEIDFHGDIYFYNSGPGNKGWWEYKARFTDGKLSKIEVIEFTLENEVA